jgi:hypothetical protein
MIPSQPRNYFVGGFFRPIQYTRLTPFLRVATDKYVLTDRVNEKKWGFKLTDALKRAKAKKGQLFAGITFYVTNKVSVDKKLLKKVVSAHGGQVSEVCIPIFRSAPNLIDDGSGP